MDLDAGISGVRENFASALGIPQANAGHLPVHGGGFGSKALLGGKDVCAKLAKAANAPVKLMLDRKEHLATGNRPFGFEDQSGRLC